jgi:hypothetical protein
MLAGCKVGPIEIKDTPTGEVTATNTCAPSPAATNTPGPPPTPTPPTNHYVKQNGVDLLPEQAEKYHQWQFEDPENKKTACGPYAAAIAANIYQGSSSFTGSDFHKNMQGRWPGGFTPPEAIVNHLQSKGVSAQVRENASKQDLLDSLDNGYVPIVLFDDPHWSVLVAYEPGHETPWRTGPEITPWGFVDPGSEFLVWVSDANMGKSWTKYHTWVKTYIEVG